ncbi:YggT family protein [bacterium]|nr:YggT family protein [bacterium]
MNDPVYVVVRLLNFALTLLTFAIIGRAILSWIQPDPRHPVSRWLRKITDPILNPLGKIIPPIAGLDITPIIAIVLIQFVQNLLPRLLLAY